MTLTRWKPFGGLQSLHDSINRLFENEFRKDLPQSTGFDTWYPAADIYETRDDYVFKLEVPGLAKDEVDVEFHDSVLTIKGEKKTEKEVKEENYHRIESFSGSFSRSFKVPRNADPAKIAAAMKNGILELRIAKAEEKKPKAISIDVK
jgi:HSP20 family protein